MEYKATDAADSAATSEGDPATGWVAVSYGSATTDAEITNLTNGVSYGVRVKASLDGVDSPWSATVSATPREDVIWAAILTVSVDEPDANLGCKSDAPTSGDMDPCTGALTEDEFEFGGVTYQWKRVSELKSTAVGASRLMSLPPVCRPIPVCGKGGCKSATTQSTSTTIATASGGALTAMGSWCSVRTLRTWTGSPPQGRGSR